MAIRLPKVLVLPHPATPSETRLYEELQKFNKAVRDAFVSGVKSGTLVVDDGLNFRLTLVFAQGRLTNVTTAASSGAACTWTDA